MRTGKKLTDEDVPKNFDQVSIDTLNRIEGNHSVIGFLFIRNGLVELNSVPENISQSIANKLPCMTNAITNMVAEIDVLDELVAFRIETWKFEVLVASDKEFSAVVIHEVKRKGKKEKVHHKKH